MSEFIIRFHPDRLPDELKPQPGWSVEIKSEDLQVVESYQDRVDCGAKVGTEEDHTYVHNNVMPVFDDEVMIIVSGESAKRLCQSLQANT